MREIKRKFGLNGYQIKIPFAIVSFLLVQGAGAVWWASQVDGRVKNLETQSLNIAKENRRYIEQVIQP